MTDWMTAQARAAQGHSQLVRGEAAAAQVVASLVAAGAGFEATPQPNGLWLIHVAYDKATILDELTGRFDPEP